MCMISFVHQLNYVLVYLGVTLSFSLIDFKGECLSDSCKKAFFHSFLLQVNLSGVVVVVNLYSHSECMQHVSRNRVRTGKQPKKHKIK